MEEACYSGYCRRIDAARTVFCEYEGEGGALALTEADCCYPHCEYAPECPVARAFLARCRGGGGFPDM